MEFKRCYACMREMDAAGGVCPRCGYDNTEGPKAQPGHALPCGTVLAGRYVIGKVLGQGGFGLTYMGYNLSLAMPVCIKEYFPRSGAMRSAAHSSAVYWGGDETGEELKRGRESFVKEAQKAVKLQDLSAVVKVWDVFYENETAYIVMNYIEGETLKNHLLNSRRTLSETECAALLRPVIAALEAAHARGIVHRDIKPDNLMLDSGGKLVLLDLGAAKDLSGGSGQSSFMVASQGFSPLEQYRKNGSIGPWTDVYALCATIVWCVAGKLLPTPMDRLSGEEIELSSLSVPLRAVLEKGLAIQPGDRIPNMAALREALDRAVAEGEREREKAAAEAARLEREQQERRVREEAERQKREEKERRARERAEQRARKKSGGGERRIPLVLTLLLLAGAVFAALRYGLPALRYEQAGAHVRAGRYAEAADIYERLGEYRDAPALLRESRQNRDFAEAEALMREGRSFEAARLLRALGDYRDADGMLRRCLGSRAAAGETHTVVLRADGTVCAAGSNDYDQCAVADWTGIVSVAAGSHHTVGLRADGTVVATGQNSYERLDVDAWRDVVQIAAGDRFTLGLRADGTLIKTGRDYREGQSVNDWTDLISVAACGGRVVGLKSDGTVLHAGSGLRYDFDVGDWSDVVAVAAGSYHILGLRADGTVLAAGSDVYGQTRVSGWRGVTAVYAGNYHSLGLRSDGTLLSAGQNLFGQCGVDDWTDLVAAAAGGRFTVGVRGDGSLVAAGDNGKGQCDVGNLHVANADTGAKPSGPNYTGTTKNGFSYEMYHDRARLTHVWATAVTVELPSRIQGKPVTEIADGAFSGCASLTDVYYLGNEEQWKAIAVGGDNEPLAKAAIHFGQTPEGLRVKLFGDHAVITGCNRADGSIELPSTIGGLPVTEIGDSAFSVCAALSSVTLPEGVTGIGYSAFSGCTGLNSLTIPDGVTSIGLYAFYNCTGLREITIPDSVTDLGYSAFSGCTGLSSVTLPAGVAAIGNSMFSGCTSLGSVTIPDSVTRIGEFAFFGCTHLRSVTLPDGVASIGQSAFNNCGNLRDVYYPGSEDQWASVAIGAANDALTKAALHFGET